MSYCQDCADKLAANALLRRQIKDIPCSWTKEWYGKRQHFDCGEPHCVRCEILGVKHDTHR